MDINWATRVITIQQSYLTLLSGSVYELDVNQLRLDLKDLEDSTEGMPYPDTHVHNTQYTISGVTYARAFQIINGYTVTFENTGTPYVVSCTGANHNIADVTNFDGGVSLLPNNSAGNIVVSSGTSGSAEDVWNYSIDGKTAKARLKTAEKKAKIAANNS